MMIGTTLRLLTRRPELLLNYVSAYSTLARDEFVLARTRLARRAIAGAVAFAALLAFLVLAGVALILVSGAAQPYAVWALVTVPGVMLFVCIAASAFALAKDAAPQRETLADQLQRDLHAFRGALETHR